jgi:hypothetical protein
LIWIIENGGVRNRLPVRCSAPTSLQRHRLHLPKICYPISRDRHGRITYTKGQRRYRRRLGDAAPDTATTGYMAGSTGVKRTREPSPHVDADPAARIADMDFEGVDVNLTLPSGWFGTWSAGDDIPHEMAMYRAYHRWMQDYCGAYPKRLGGISSLVPATSTVPWPKSSTGANPAGPGASWSMPQSACRSIIPHWSRSTPRPQSSISRWYCTHSP